MKKVLLLLCLLMTSLSFSQFDEEEEATPLMKAVLANNLAQVKTLVEGGASIESGDRFSFDDEPLDVAVKNNYQEIAKYLLSKGATSREYFYTAIGFNDVNWIKTLLSYRYYDGEAVLAAVEANNITMVKLLIENGFPVDFEQKRRTGLFRKEYVSPLDAALDNNSDPIVLELVKAGAPILYAYNYAALYGRELLCTKLIDLCENLDELMLASFDAKKLKLVKYCITKGAQANAVDSEGKNALHRAVMSGYEEGIDFCIGQLKIDPNSRTTKGENVLMLAAKSSSIPVFDKMKTICSLPLEDMDGNGNTLVFYASEGKNIQIVEKILAMGANINHQNNEGSTVWMEALRLNQWAQYELFKLHEPNYLLKTNNNKNIISFLMGSSSSQYKTELMRLINLPGIDLNTTSLEGSNMAFYAMNEDNMELMNIMKAKGLSFKASNDSGKRPEGCSDEIIRFAIENGCDPNSTDSWGRTYLYDALNQNKIDLAVFLIRHGADVNFWKGSSSEDPLIMQMVDRNNLEGVMFLVENHANIQAVDYWKQNVMELALEEGNEAIISYLRSKGAMTSKEYAAEEIRRLQEKEKIGQFINDKNVPAALQLMKKYPDIKLNQEKLNALAVMCTEQTNIELLQFLMVNQELNLNALINFQEQTLLHLAVEKGNIDFIRLLVNKGADPNKKDALDKLPIDYSKSKEVKKYLKSLN